MQVRSATTADAASMSVILSEILAVWKVDRPSSDEHICAFYIEHPDRVACLVAEAEDAGIVGFQSLKVAPENNSWGVNPGWGFIGTYVKIGAGRKGTGQALFAATKEAARLAGLPYIDATIAEDNDQGLAYYEAMGFQTYRRQPGMISKVYSVSGSTSPTRL